MGPEDTWASLTLDRSSPKESLAPALIGMKGKNGTDPEIELPGSLRPLRDTGPSSLTEKKVRERHPLCSSDGDLSKKQISLLGWIRH